MAAHRRRMRAVVVVGLIGLSGAPGIHAAEGLQFAETKPLVLDAKKPATVRLVVPPGLQGQVEVQDTSDSVTVGCDGAPATSSACALKGTTVVHAITVAWDGTQPGEGVLIASAPGFAATLPFAANGLASQAPKGVLPAEVMFRVDKSSIQARLPAMATPPAGGETLSGQGPTRVAPASFLVDKTGGVFLVAKKLDRVGTYTWTIDHDGDRKTDLTVKVDRRQPFWVCLLLLVVGALAVSALIYLRDDKLARLVHRQDIDDLRAGAQSAEVELVTAMKSVDVGGEVSRWQPATQGTLKAELDRLESSLAAADRRGGDKFKMAESAIRALARAAQGARRAVADLDRLEVGAATTLVTSSQTTLGQADFAGAVETFADQVAPLEGLANDLANAIRIQGLILGLPGQDTKDFLTQLGGFAHTDKDNLTLLERRVRSAAGVPAEQADTAIVVAGESAHSGLSVWRRAWAWLGTVRRVQTVYLVGAGVLAVMSGMATQYFSTNTWGSTGDVLKALTWAAGTTFAVDAAAKLALSLVIGAKTGTASSSEQG